MHLAVKPVVWSNSVPIDIYYYIEQVGTHITPGEGGIGDALEESTGEGGLGQTDELRRARGSHETENWEERRTRRGQNEGAALS